MTGALCSSCRGRGFCGKPCPIFSKFNILGKINEEFSGESPPSVFVGKAGYPKVFAGVLAPCQEVGEAGMLDSPEQWYTKGMKIEDILGFRSQMIYSRFKASIKSPSGKLMDIQQSIACSDKPCQVDVKLEKKPKLQIDFDNYSTPIANPANIKEMHLAGNVHIPLFVDKIVSDIDMDAVSAVNNLYQRDLEISKIQKIFSSGLLGVKFQRKLVPTRWAITATDDMVSQEMMDNIRDFPILDDFRLFANNYLGNHYEILLIPRQWSFELIEAKFPGSVWNATDKNIIIYADYESHYKRKTYASNTVGGYYAARLAATEYLNKIRKQATVFILRECMPEYFAPLGVWVCRETCRHAFDNAPVKFDNLDSALAGMQSRIKVPWNDILRNSKLIKEIRLQKTLKEF